MKKLFTLTLAILVAFSVVGCGKTTDNIFKNTGDISGYTYPKFLDADWGMSVEQAMTALGKTESDFEKRDISEDFPDAVNQSGIVYYETTMEVAGAQAKVILCFSIETELKMSEPVVGLVGVSVVTADENTIKLANEAKTAIEKSDKYIGKFKAFEFLEKMDKVSAFGTYYDKLMEYDTSLEKYNGEYSELVKQDCEKFPIRDMAIIENKDGKTTIQYRQEFIARYKYFDKVK